MVHRRTDDDNDAAEAAEEEERSSAAEISPPSPAAASPAGAISTSAGVEYNPAPDDAPVPVAQTYAAYDAVEKVDKKKGEEIIQSSGEDAPVPDAAMDTSYYDEAEKGSARRGVKSVELIDHDEEGPLTPAQIAGDDISPKMKEDGAGPGTVNRPPAQAETVDAGSIQAMGALPAVRPPPPSMMPRDPSASEPAVEPSVPVFHEVHARLVEDEPEPPQQPVYDAVPVGEEHWAKRHQKKIIGGFVAVIVALVVALGVSFGTGGDGSEGGEGDATRTVIFATSSPTTSLSPSSQPTMYPRRCFMDREELKNAVDDYTEGGIPCFAGDDSCEVVQKYGWPIGSWCTSNVTDMHRLFLYKRFFNEDLSSWDTSQVTTMKGMFEGASSFNGDVSSFDTSQVTSIDDMFYGATVFDGDVSNFNTSAVTSMRYMFYEASSFNGDVGNFDTSQVTTMYHMFDGASSFNRDVSHFDTSKVMSMNAMFSWASSFNGDLSNFDTSAVTSMHGMFNGASSFNGDVTHFDTSRVTSMDAMFERASSFNGDVSNFDTSAVTSMRNTFWASSSFNRDVSSFDTSKVNLMAGMFNGARSFNQDVSSWDVSSVTGMQYMFYGATSFNQNLCAWGQHYSRWTYGKMFEGTNCASEGDPDGPYTNWCAATCNSTEQTPS